MGKRADMIGGVWAYSRELFAWETLSELFASMWDSVQITLRWAQEEVLHVVNFPRTSLTQVRIQEIAFSQWVAGLSGDTLRRISEKIELSVSQIEA